MRNTTAWAVLAFMAGAANAQMTGIIADAGCGALIPDNRAVGGELYVMKTHNGGGGPDWHADWLFDVSAKGGSATPSTDVGGPMWEVIDNFHAHTVPPEELFAIVTYPSGWMAIDSADVRGNDALGVVQRQHVGDSPPVGTLAGIGLTLPGDARTYTAAITDRRSGGPARFPYGTATGIEIAFAPIVGVNSTDLNGSGCTLGGEIVDPESGFGLIEGYNVFRIQGVPGQVPTPADFMGGWQYYIPYNTFDTSVPDTTGAAGPDVNGDTLPDGDATPAPSDGRPNDLAGLQNPDGLPYTGDEVLIFQDSERNPDGTPRISGTGPGRSPGIGYWYAVQPVLFQGRTTLNDYDGIGFSDPAVFVGANAVDTDADGIADSLDVDLDGSLDFYSPQVVIGQTGLGLTNGGLPLLSSPVFGRVNPAAALGQTRITGRTVGSQVHLTLTTGLEAASIVGYNVRRLEPSGAPGVLLNASLIPARGGEGNAYVLVDRIPAAYRRAPRTTLAYGVEVVFQDGVAPVPVGPFMVEGPSPMMERRRR